LDLIDFIQDNQVRLIVVFFDDFSLVQQSQQRQLTENLFFHFFLVCIPSSNTSVAFRLIVWLRSKVRLIVKFYIFLPSFFAKETNCNSFKNTPSLLILLRNLQK